MKTAEQWAEEAGVIIEPRSVRDKILAFYRAIQRDASGENHTLNAEIYDIKDRLLKAESILERCGYRHCGIPACNCNGYHKHHSTLEENINRAAIELPDGWIIEIGVENGAGWVDLQAADGNCVDVSSAGSINEQVSEAIAYAKEHSD